MPTIVLLIQVLRDKQTHVRTHAHTHTRTHTHTHTHTHTVPADENEIDQSKFNLKGQNIQTY